MSNTDDEVTDVASGVWWTPAVHDRFIQWVTRHYRESPSSDDLADPTLIEESRAAIAEQEKILGIRIGP